MAGCRQGLLAGSSTRNRDQSPCTCSLHVTWAAHKQAGWFHRKITSRRKIQKNLVENLKASDLALEIHKHYNNLLCWFRIQGATQIQKEESIPGQEYGKKMMVIFGNQLLYVVFYLCITNAGRFWGKFTDSNYSWKQQEVLVCWLVHHIGAWMW